MYEIETKLKIDSFEPVLERLKQTEARYREHQDQLDLYFENSAGTMKNDDKALRLRRSSVDGQTSYVLTYKGPKEPSQIKRRKEIEIEVSDLEVCRDLLVELGYEEAITVEKNRQIWEIDSCLICLDSVTDIGLYLEIEGPDEKAIEKIQSVLGLEDYPHVTDSYACLKQRLASGKGSN